MKVIKQARVAPRKSWESLSRLEIEALLCLQKKEVFGVFKRSAFAVLISEIEETDLEELEERYHQFDIRIKLRSNSIELELKNAPSTAFVDGKMIAGIEEHLFAVVRDVLLKEINPFQFPSQHCGKMNAEAVATDEVFFWLRRAGIFDSVAEAKLVVCWGGHIIDDKEYHYSKTVGYELGLRSLDICTGSGPGAMRAPMEGAAIAHAKDRTLDARYIGITEPSIIATESPNTIVNHLILMPNVEIRLEAFVRLAHGIIIFPGGVGTLEELFFLLGLLMHPKNQNPSIRPNIILTGPREAERYFELIDQFVGDVLGLEAQQKYKIIVNHPTLVAQEITQGIEQFRQQRTASHQGMHFNWELAISQDLQKAFKPSHSTMDLIQIQDAEPHILAANFRRFFSAIATGHVKREGIEAVKKEKFVIQAEKRFHKLIMSLMDKLTEEKRIRLNNGVYEPCFRLIESN